MQTDPSYCVNGLLPKRRQLKGIEGVKKAKRKQTCGWIVAQPRTTTNRILPPAMDGDGCLWLVGRTRGVCEFECFG